MATHSSMRYDLPPERQIWNPILGVRYTHYDAQGVYWRYDNQRTRWWRRDEDMQLYQHVASRPPPVQDRGPVYANTPSYTKHHGHKRGGTEDSGKAFDFGSGGDINDRMRSLTVASDYSFQRSDASIGAQTSPSKETRLESQYRVRHRKEKFFIFGRVFKTCWNEAMGATAKDTSAGISINAYGGLVFSKNRIFVVVKDNENDCSQCLPIVTHGRQGVSNPRLVKNHHAIIYSNKEPEPLPRELPRKGEGGMRRSIEVKLRSQRDVLDPMSRIHYNMSYPIHHNLEVYEIGRVAAGHLDILYDEWIAVSFPRHYQSLEQRVEEEDEEEDEEEPELTEAEPSDAWMASDSKKKRKKKKTTAAAAAAMSRYRDERVFYDVFNPN